jgi:hypothetical protein
MRGLGDKGFISKSAEREESWMVENLWNMGLSSFTNDETLCFDEV